MIRQLGVGFAGLVLVAVALWAFMFGGSVPEFMASFVLAVAGVSALVWSVGAS